MYETVLRSEGGGIKEKDGGVNLTKIYCKNFCKCHKVSLYNYNMLTNKIFKRWEMRSIHPLTLNKESRETISYVLKRDREKEKRGRLSGITKEPARQQK
jgi:hypothetical protein